MKFNWKRYIYLLLLLIIGYSLAISQISRMRRDGLWWQALEFSHKHNYIVGYSRGIVYGGNAAIERFKKDSRCYKKGEAFLDTVLNMLKKIDIEVMISKIDSVYKTDSTNLCLMTFHCFWIVSNQLANYNKEEIDNLLLYYRREDCDRFKSIQELKDYKLSY